MTMMMMNMMMTMNVSP